MNEFAKLFNVNGKQLLVYKDYDPEDDMYEMNCMIDSEVGALVTVSPKFQYESERDKVFLAFDQDQAVKMYSKIRQLIEL